MDDEGVPEIAQIHQSPQKRHSSITGAAALKNFQTESPLDSRTARREKKMLSSMADVIGSSP
jgi:hypothetical protein